MVTITDTPRSTATKRKSPMWFRLLSFKKHRLSYSSVLAAMSFVAVGWRLLYTTTSYPENHEQSYFFFQPSSSSFVGKNRVVNSIGAASKVVPPTTVLFSSDTHQQARSLLNEKKKKNADNNNTTESEKHYSNTLLLPPAQQRQQSLPPYVKKYCDFRVIKNATTRGVNGTATTTADEREVEWWPEDKRNWRRRAPAVLIIGAKKAGTTSLWLSLLRRAYPRVARARVKELLYFIPDRFRGWADSETKSKVLVHQARHYMYHEQDDYPIERLQKYEHHISLDATPDYLLYSTYSPRAILCTIPWVQIIVLLRNPIDRLFSHYNFLIDPNIVGLTNLPSFDEWVNQDIARLQGYGILPDDLSRVEEHSGSIQERQGWRAYQHAFHGNDDRPVARSLYAIQLEEWFHHLRAVGKDPADCVKIVLSDDFDQHPEAVVENIMDWMGLPRKIPSRQQQPKQQQQRRRRRLQRKQKAQQQENPKGMVTTYTSPPMKEETRQKLELLFAPYNRRLYQLLGPEWEGIFDAK